MADEPKASARRYRVADLEDWTVSVFATCGVPEHQARDAAHAMVRSDMRGYRTHGLARVASYVERFVARDFNPVPDMKVSTRNGIVIVDADGALGHVAAPLVREAAAAELKRSASVFVAVRECGHLGALGIHTLAAAEAGVFCLMGQRTPPLLAMEGFKEPGIGHNPIAFGCPLAGKPPIVFDVACSVAARGHILLAAREGRPIPADWALDREGQPTTDSRAAVHGMLLPMGGHKGIGIAMLVECLAGAFTATAESLANFVSRVPEAGAVGRQSAFFWFMDPSAFAGREVFDAYMHKWTEVYRQAGGRLPGSRGAELERAAHERGIAIASNIEGELRAVGERMQAPFAVAAIG